MAARESIKFEIINVQTGEQRMSRDNLFESLYKKKLDSNGNSIWRKKSDVKGESLGTLPVKQKTSQVQNDNTQIQFLKNEIEALGIRVSELENGLLNCCKKEETPVKTEVIVNPFDIVEESILKGWLIENNIPFPKTVKKLDSLRNYIPEIYKYVKSRGNIETYRI